MRMQLGIALVIAQGAAQDFVVPMFGECLATMCTDTCSYLQIDCMAPFDSMAVAQLGCALGDIANAICRIM
jgi:hypothetical protein